MISFLFSGKVFQICKVERKDPGSIAFRASGPGGGRERLFLAVLMFAFSWVVVGDLVQFHLDLIYSHAAHSWHQPFTKADGDHGKTLKTQKKVKDGNGDHPVLGLCHSIALFLYEGEASVLKVPEGEHSFRGLFRLPSLRAPPIL